MSIEEIIKKLEEIVVMLDGLRSAYPETGKSGMADVLREAIALLRTHPDNQPNEMESDGWISVKDSFPKPGMEVLTYDEKGVTAIDAICSDGEWMNWNAVDYWRPLPEPPKES